ncbi:MAG: DNA replication/repair protein RecF [Bacillota bacterium]
MHIKKILTHNFRNLKNETLKLDPGINIVIGKNGQGKTNFLETIYLLATGQSHRTSNNKEMINWNKEKFLVQALISKNESDIKLSFSRDKSTKTIKINDKPIEKLTDFIGTLNVVLFSPEDLKLVKGSPSQRRKFINMEVSQVSSYYHHLLNKYRNILKQRNNLLKEINYKGLKSQEKMLEVWDEQISETGSKIVKKRLEVINKIKILSRLMQRKITDGNENLNIEYEDSLNCSVDGNYNKDYELIFKEKLVNNRKKEIQRGYTTIGPQRDDLLLEINGKDVRKFGSQGQQRTVALALKMAELEFMKSEIGEYPVLLLDDVFSELDRERKNLLIDLIKEKIQTLITSTQDDYINMLKEEAKIMLVKNGVFSTKRVG